jgi:hypothetical protein
MPGVSDADDRDLRGTAAAQTVREALPTRPSREGSADHQYAAAKIAPVRAAFAVASGGAAGIRVVHEASILLSSKKGPRERPPTP